MRHRCNIYEKLMISMQTLMIINVFNALIAETLMLVVKGMGCSQRGGGVLCKCGVYNGSNHQFYLLFDLDFSTL